MSLTRFLKMRDDRLRKAEELRQAGIDPFPSTSRRTHLVGRVVDRFAELEGTTVTVAGRLMAKRKHGKIAFLEVRDQSGDLQLFLRSELLGDPLRGDLHYDQLGLLDVGDIVEARGQVLRTERGEISVQPVALRLLTKCYRPLPDKRFGITDRELMLRRRYVHLTMAPEERDPFTAIGRMLLAARQFLDAAGFVEFHTPVLQPLYGGGTAKPFRTHLAALDQEMFLAISHELYLKRLITAGFDKVYTIGRYFRNEGIDATHHPEFSMIETMAAYENYVYSMDLVEGLFKHCAREAFGRTTFQVRGRPVDLGAPWRRVSMVDLVTEATGFDFARCSSVTAAHELLGAKGIEPRPDTVGECLYLAYDLLAAGKLVEPTLVFGHPVEVSPLAKPMADDPRYAERFEIIIGGVECGDNWSEANDPEQLRRVWAAARQARMVDGEESHPMDYDFLEVMEHGMPPTTGIGPGIERMAMIFCERTNIDDVLFFPMMRPWLSPENRAIYEVDHQDPPPDERAPIALTPSQLAPRLEGRVPGSVAVVPVLTRWADGGVTGHLEVELAPHRVVVGGFDGVDAEGLLARARELLGEVATLGPVRVR